MARRIVVTWTMDEAAAGLPGFAATVRDLSPPMDELDLDRALDVASEGLGIRFADVRPVAVGPGEVAAWVVRHGETGVAGRLAVEEVG